MHPPCNKKRAFAAVIGWSSHTTINHERNAHEHIQPNRTSYRLPEVRQDVQEEAVRPSVRSKRHLHLRSNLPCKPGQFQIRWGAILGSRQNVQKTRELSDGAQVLSLLPLKIPLRLRHPSEAFGSRQPSCCCLILIRIGRCAENVWAQLITGNCAFSSFFNLQTIFRRRNAICSIQPIPYVWLMNSNSFCHCGLPTTNLNCLFKIFFHAAMIKQLFCLCQNNCGLFVKNSCFNMKKWH